MIFRRVRPAQRENWPVTLDEQLVFHGQVLDKIAAQAQERLNETVPRVGTQPT